MKSWRQSQILEVIDREAISSQEGLRQKLQERGISATQATLSRDLKELGLVKRARRWRLYAAGQRAGQPGVGDLLRRAVASQMRGLERVELLLILQTDPGQAQGLAILFDGPGCRRWRARWRATTPSCWCVAGSSRPSAWSRG